MIVTVQAERLRTMEQVRAFVEGCEPVDHQPRDRAGAHAFVRRTLVRFDYRRPSRGLDPILWTARGNRSVPRLGSGPRTANSRPSPRAELRKSW